MGSRSHIQSKEGSKPHIKTSPMEMGCSRWNGLDSSGLLQGRELEPTPIVPALPSAFTFASPTAKEAGPSPPHPRRRKVVLGPLEVKGVDVVSGGRGGRERKEAVHGCRGKGREGKFCKCCS